MNETETLMKTWKFFLFLVFMSFVAFLMFSACEKNEEDDEDSESEAEVNDDDDAFDDDDSTEDYWDECEAEYTYLAYECNYDLESWIDDDDLPIDIYVLEMMVLMCSEGDEMFGPESCSYQCIANNHDDCTAMISCFENCWYYYY